MNQFKPEIKKINCDLFKMCKSYFLILCFLISSLFLSTLAFSSSPKASYSSSDISSRRIRSCSSASLAALSIKLLIYKVIRISIFLLVFKINHNQLLSKFRLSIIVQVLNHYNVLRCVNIQITAHGSCKFNFNLHELKYNMILLYINIKVAFSCISKI